MDAVMDVLARVESDLEGFIEDVKKYPEIWDIRHDSYHDRTKKRSAWIQVCSVFCEDFAGKGEGEKNTINNALVKKWKNLKDAYIKSLKKPKSGSAGRPNRAYIYGRQLSFLKQTAVQSETDSSLISGEAQTMEGSDEEDIDDPSLPRSSNSVPVVESGPRSNTSPPRSQTMNSAKKRKRHLEESLINFMNTPLPPLTNNEVRPPPPNPNLSFFESLLPILDTFTNEEVVDFRLEVLKLVKMMQYTQRNRDSAMRYPTTDHGGDSLDRHMLVRNRPYAMETDSTSMLYSSQRPHAEFDYGTPVPHNYSQSIDVTASRQPTPHHSSNASVRSLSPPATFFPYAPPPNQPRFFPNRKPHPASGRNSVESQHSKHSSNSPALTSSSSSVDQEEGDYRMTNIDHAPHQNQPRSFPNRLTHPALGPNSIDSQHSQHSRDSPALTTPSVHQHGYD